MSDHSGLLPSIGNASKKSKVDVKKGIDAYNAQFAGGHDSTDKQKERNDNTEEGGKELVKNYYAVATDFYEHGWGEMFHFGAATKGMSMDASLRLHEIYLAQRANFKAGQKIADFGCGIAGPARNIARFTQAHVTGVTISDVQVARAKELNKKYNCEKLVDVICADFLKTGLKDESMDHVYTIEATCHTTDKIGVFGEAYRVLKPGGYFVGYEWCTTPAYNPDNEEHRRVRFGIEQGDGLPETAPTTAIDKALIDVGFELEEAFDMAERSEVPWYQPLEPSFTISGFRHTKYGHYCTHYLVLAMEKIGLAPPGSTAVSEMLMGAAENLVKGGKMGIYTTMYFFLARKPLDK